MDNEKRLAEIEVELEIVRKEIRVKEQNDFYLHTDPATSWDNFSKYMKPEWDRQSKLDREKRMLMTPVLERDVPSYGHQMPLKEFIECVEEGGFIDYDGSGEYTKDGKMSGITINPSDVDSDSIRNDFDTIIWFNK